MQIESLYQIFGEHPTITTDSRNCEKGSIFFALKGQSFNGNNYAEDALKKGCSYAVVDEHIPINDERIIFVDNVLTTLQILARHHRRTLATRIIGITGTNGKTTTKELIATVLAKKYNVLYTQGNLNNHIGVPITLLRLSKQHEIAVIEMGANHPGEIKALVDIVEPNYGIITNVGKAHLEGFGSLEGVIRTKGELYDYLRAHNGEVFVNENNEHLMHISHGLQLQSYGNEGKIIACDPYLQIEYEGSQIATHLIGSYNIDNCLAATAIGKYFGVGHEAICDALASYAPLNNRSQLLKTASNTLLIDAYNANPTSMMAALANFRDMMVKDKMMILGDMQELGTTSLKEHQTIVDFIPQVGAKNVWLVGEEFAKTHCNYRKFPDVNAVKTTIENEKPNGYHILIKGSNSTRLYQLQDNL